MRTSLVIVAALAALGCGKPLYESNPPPPVSSTSSTGSTGSTGAGVGQPIVIAGTRRGQDVLFVVDRSGSMADNPDGTVDSQCQGATGQQGSTCKWDAMLALMTGSNGYIAQLANVLVAASGVAPNFGMVTFSGFDASQSATVENSCSPGVLQFPLATADSTRVQSMSDKLLSLVPAGATPTAATLGQAASAFTADGRDQYLILLTDGAPNCDADFVATADNCGGDRCVSNGACYGQQYSPYGCLDEDNTVGAVQQLHDAKGVTTFVIGFGADFLNTTAPANETLDRMARAGGAPRTDSSGNAVEPAFYWAADATDLTTALGSVKQDLNARCTFALDAAAPANFTGVALASSSSTASVPMSKFFLSADRLTAVVLDDTACTTVTGSPVTFTFAE